MSEWNIEDALQLLSGTSNPLYRRDTDQICQLDDGRVSALEQCPAPLRDALWAANMFFRSNSGDECDFLMHIEHVSPENRATVLDWLMKRLLRIAKPQCVLMVIWATVENADALGVEIPNAWTEMLKSTIAADRLHHGPGSIHAHYQEKAQTWLDAHPTE